ncbi:MAG: hypothetical protein J2P21_18635 [Chloracidobacterium sp.]|nr:hypothetical protein [Chloracidobacterium sp.]
MGGVISFSDKNEEIWGVVAGWAFRQVLDDVISNHPEDSDMTDAFAKAEAIGDLQIYSLELELAARVTRAIWHVGTAVLSGAIRSGIHDQPYGDARRIEQYRNVLQELLDIIPTAWRGSVIQSEVRRNDIRHYAWPITAAAPVKRPSMI